MPKSRLGPSATKYKIWPMKIKIRWLSGRRTVEEEAEEERREGGNEVFLLCVTGLPRINWTFPACPEMDRFSESIGGEEGQRQTWRGKAKFLFLFPEFDWGVSLPESVASSSSSSRSSSSSSSSSSLNNLLTQFLARPKSCSSSGRLVKKFVLNHTS